MIDIDHHRPRRHHLCAKHSPRYETSQGSAAAAFRGRGTLEGSEDVVSHNYSYRLDKADRRMLRLAHEHVCLVLLPWASGELGVTICLETMFRCRSATSVQSSAFAAYLGVPVYATRVQSREHTGSSTPFRDKWCSMRPVLYPPAPDGNSTKDLIPVLPSQDIVQAFHALSGISPRYLDGAYSRSSKTASSCCPGHRAMRSALLNLGDDDTSGTPPEPETILSAASQSHPQGFPSTQSVANTIAARARGWSMRSAYAPFGSKAGSPELSRTKLTSPRYSHRLELREGGQNHNGAP
ncbi:hypothetical protein C8Q76DRAFT_691407 [Earliella scabrosa]|nr:hypothetical protein C8Q76DRAFT_691407 [Earliella scabrosa]